MLRHRKPQNIIKATNIITFGYSKKNAECFEESPWSTRWDAGTLVASC